MSTGLRPLAAFVMVAGGRRDQRGLWRHPQQHRHRQQRRHQHRIPSCEGGEVRRVYARQRVTAFPYRDATGALIEATTGLGWAA
jgi:hypothetical protein